MTELQIGLIVFAIAGVVAIVVYNQWQDARQRRKAEEILRRHPVDPLLDDNDNQINVNNPPQPDPSRTTTQTRTGNGSQTAMSATAKTQEPSLDDGLESGSATQDGENESGRTREPPPPLSEMQMNIRVDYPVKLELPGRITAGRIVMARQSTLSRVKKPVRWFGFDERNQAWIPIDATTKTRVRHFLVGLQLADRQGPASETDLTVFRAAIEKLAARINIEVDFLPLRPALSSAVELDQFCVGIDVQIGINLIPRGPVFVAAKVRDLVKKAGLIEQENGSYLYRDKKKGASLFTLTSIDDKVLKEVVSVPGLTLLLDIPHTPAGEHAFDCMAELAHQLADALDALIVDDNRHPLTQDALKSIRDQVTGYQQALEQAKIPAGSPLALRLFA